MSKIFINLINDYQASNSLDTNIQIGPHNTRKVVGAICMAHGVDLIFLAKVMGFSSPTIMKKNYGGKAPHLSDLIWLITIVCYKVLALTSTSYTYGGVVSNMPMWYLRYNNGYLQIVFP